MGTFFVAGVYGVGKSTLCEQLSVDLNIPSFSAGDLISQVNGEQYGANKAVSDKSENQDILAVEVQQLLLKHSKILLAGHFCIFNREQEVEYLPKDIFKKLSITKILLLEADVEAIIAHLSIRDKRQYTHQQIFRLQSSEHSAAIKTAQELDCNIDIYSMKFDSSDLAYCRNLIR